MLSLTGKKCDQLLQLIVKNGVSRLASDYFTGITQTSWSVRLVTLVNQRGSKTFSHNNAKTSSFTTAAGGGFIKPTTTFSGESAAVFKAVRFQSNIAGEQLSTVYYEEDGHHQINDENQDSDNQESKLDALDKSESP
ncbi:hypothetical protein RND71_028119 [Anisodus tanguticus]|uniref:Uncharacterized protein n=1 Tax=Anisodus tanguticus TaxID=243964 RepID=A0AAE1V6U6_9SOLA|nr:hypothetical protein RND71_028119 [Anisodus tanguticus]